MIKSDRRTRSLPALAFLLLATAPACALAAGDAACNPNDARPAQVAQAWLDRKPIPALELADVTAARCFRQAFLESLEPVLGPQIGYKVGLYTAAGQARYGSAGPVLGLLFRNMLIPEGQLIAANYGVQPTWESDLLVVVGDGAINTARTREDIYRNLRAIRPFIELTNVNYDPGVKVNALQLEALDVGARMGVAGAETVLPQTPKGLADLSALSVETTLRSEGKDAVERVRAVEALGDPIEIVRFARDAALAAGHPLKAGDVISLGVFTPAKAPRPNDVVSVRYLMGDQAPSVSARFK